MGRGLKKNGGHKRAARAIQGSILVVAAHKNKSAAFLDRHRGCLSMGGGDCETRGAYPVFRIASVWPTSGSRKTHIPCVEGALWTLKRAGSRDPLRQRRRRAARDMSSEAFSDAGEGRAARRERASL